MLHDPRPPLQSRQRFVKTNPWHARTLQSLAFSSLLLICAMPLAAQEADGADDREARFASSNPDHPIFDQGRRIMVAERLEEGEEFHLDGRLDEPFWSRVQPADDFIMQEPSLGGTPTEATEVRIAFDHSNLYMGVTAYDSEPDRLMGNTMKRDEFLSADDRFMWTIDTYLDQQTGYFFEMNPSGLMADAVMGPNGGNNREWDGIWDARVHQSDIGYTIEIVIPFRTINFDPMAPAWGINFQRTVRRKNEETLWTGYQRNQGLRRMSNAGLLVGIQDVGGQGIGLEVRPYAAAKYTESPGTNPSLDGEGDADIGLDLYYNVTPNLRANLTVNTDFAETEVDQRQVNLTRFPLFFPERRGFFLEGQTSFDVFTPPEIRLFFSRRIGLDAAGVPQPIDGGLKLTGQVGRNNIGALAVRTRETDDVLGEDFLVFRGQRQLFTQSSVGGIYTLRRQRGDDLGGYHTLGADFSLSTSRFLGSQNLGWFGMISTTPGPGIEEDNLSYASFIQYPNDRWQASFYTLTVEPNYNPAVGFLRRRNFRSYNPNVAWAPRPVNHPLIRQFEFRARMSYITDLDNDLLTREIELTPFSVSTHSGDNLSLSVSPTYELLDRDFEIYPGVRLFEGADYTFNRYGVNVRTANRRLLAVRAGYTVGTFLSGNRQDAVLELGLRPMPGITLNGYAERNDVNLPEGDFVTHVVRFIADTQFNPRMYIVNNIQYDSLSGLLGWQGRFRWTVNPGNDLYLVYTHNWLDDVGVGEPGLRRFDTLNRRAAMKINYTRRF